MGKDRSGGKPLKRSGWIWELANSALKHGVNGTAERETPALKRRGVGNRRSQIADRKQAGKRGSSLLAIAGLDDAILRD